MMPWPWKKLMGLENNGGIQEWPTKDQKEILARDR